MIKRTVPLLVAGTKKLEVKPPKTELESLEVKTRNVGRAADIEKMADCMEAYFPRCENRRAIFRADRGLCIAKAVS